MAERWERTFGASAETYDLGPVMVWRGSGGDLMVRGSGRKWHRSDESPSLAFDDLEC